MSRVALSRVRAHPAMAKSRGPNTRGNDDGAAAAAGGTLERKRTTGTGTVLPDSDVAVLAPAALMAWQNGGVRTTRCATLWLGSYCVCVFYSRSGVTLH